MRAHSGTTRTSPLRGERGGDLSASVKGGAHERRKNVSVPKVPQANQINRRLKEKELVAKPVWL